MKLLIHTLTTNKLKTDARRKKFPKKIGINPAPLKWRPQNGDKYMGSVVWAVLCAAHQQDQSYINLQVKHKTISKTPVKFRYNAK